MPAFLDGLDGLDDLDAEQRAAALAVTGPVCIIAGAGTGKTRTVTYRLAHGIVSKQVDPKRALAITHSRKAAAELAGRLHAVGAGTVDARTFHAAGLRVAGQFWARTGRREPAPAVLADGESWRLWRDSLRAVVQNEPDNATVRDLIDEVEWARSRLVEAEDYEGAAVLAGRDSGIEPATVLAAWRRYVQAKARLGRVDFADLLEIAAQLLRTDDGVADTVRARWAHVTVDEYQDTDPAQQRLLDAILGVSREICVVGDPRQAIYSWKGADPSYLTRFPKRYPEAHLFDLTRNYRSSSQILAWANRVACEPGTRPLVATGSAGPNPKIRQLDTEAGEAAWVAGAAGRAIAAGTPASQIAVLYRFNSTQARFEAALARADIATVVADDVTFFERDEIRAVLVPFGRAARVEPDQNGFALLHEMLARRGFNPESPPPGLGAARTRWESQQALVDLLEALPDARRCDARALLGEVNSLARRTADRPAEGVTLATLHRAKGLEWDMVFVVGVTDGAIPSAYATTPPARAEEERLLHVGVTRARRELFLTWATVNARGWTNRPSPYLDVLPAGRPSSPQGRARRSTGKGADLAGRRSGSTPATASCPHCAAPLKGLSPRRLGVCADCVVNAPGDLGRRARAVVQIATDAAKETGSDPEKLVTRDGLLRLLDKRPDAGDGVAATLGVQLSGRWAARTAAVLRRNPD
jgi:DNA helicase-2/ATP-dependent DNA helicase PcrA